MEIDLNALETRHAHDLMTSSIIPRPIAWVSTINHQGKINLAPFSFFTGVSWAPPIVAFSAVNRSDGTKKDTVINIEQTKEFVINIVPPIYLKRWSVRPSQFLTGKMKATLKVFTYHPPRQSSPTGSKRQRSHSNVNLSE